MFSRKTILLFTTLWLLLLALTPTAQAQGIPSPFGGNGSVNYLTQIQAIVDQMVSSHIDIFVAEGQTMLTGMTVVVLIYTLGLWLFAGRFPVEKFVEFVFLYLTTFSMLQFYDSPLPWGSGSSFHSIFADEARWIDGTIDVSILNTLALGVKNIIDNAKIPIGLDVVGFVAYAGLIINVSLLWFLSFGITAASYIALSVGSMLGSLFIPFLMWPFMSWVFTGWLRYMFIYSLWRVMATCVVAVFANMSVWFINSIVGGDLSVGHIASLVPAWIALNVACLYVLWMSHSLARDMVSGSASLGNSLSAISGVVAAGILRA
jgi:hypothetical protein